MSKSAPTSWHLRALEALRRVARRMPSFDVDDVWDLVGEAPRDRRAMAMVLKAGQQRKLCEPTAESRPSRNPGCHRAPRRVWRSLLIAAPPVTDPKARAIAEALWKRHTSILFQGIAYLGVARDVTPANAQKRAIESMAAIVKEHL